MMQVFALGGRQVKPAMESNLIKLLSESQGDERVDTELRCLAVKQLYDMVVDPLAPANVLRVAIWIFGEYGHLSTDPSLSQIVDVLGDIWKRPALSSETKSYLIGAFMKISSQSQKIPTMASEIVKECMRSHDTELVQQAIEFREMCKSGAKVFLAAIPEKAEGSVIIDPEMHFLDSYVMQGRLAGMKDYEEHNLSDDDEKTDGLITEAYEAPPEPVPSRVAAPEKELKKEDGFIDFSAVKGTFGFQPVEPPKPATPAVSEAAPEAVEEPQTGADLFSGMETSGDGLFDGMESATPEPKEPEEPDEQALEAAALFSGVGGAPSVAKPKRVQQRAFFKPVVAQATVQAAPAVQPIAQAPAVQPIAQAPAVQPAQPTAPAPVAQPTPQAEPTDMFAAMTPSTEPMFDMLPAAPVQPKVIDMSHCRLSDTYKIFMKEPCSDVTVMNHDDHVFLAHYFIYRVCEMWGHHP